MKICNVFHSRDLDGWMSAAIVKKYYDDKLDNNDITFIPWDYGDNIPDLSDYDKVIMCDVSFPENNMRIITYDNQENESFIWLDHHISAINISKNKYDHICGSRNTKFAACELTWEYFFPNEEMPEIVRLLGMYDSFRHKSTDEEQKVLEFQYGARQVISNYEEAFEAINFHHTGLKNKYNITNILNKGKAIYQYLCTEAKQTYKKAFPIRINNKAHTKDNDELFIAWDFLCVNKGGFNPSAFNLEYEDDGFATFSYKDGKWLFTLYSDKDYVDCSKIAKQYGGGGHKGTAGFVCDNKTVLKIINSK